MQYHADSTCSLNSLVQIFWLRRMALQMALFLGFSGKPSMHKNDQIIENLSFKVSCGISPKSHL
jgi:hypothetical protein